MPRPTPSTLVLSGSKAPPFDPLRAVPIHPGLEPVESSTHPPIPPSTPFPLQIQTSSLALGYYPDRFFHGTFHPDDLGYFDDAGELHIVGRSSDKIITGGENVFPAEVEAAIRATGQVQDVCVVGVSDRHWGEIVAAAYVPATSTSSAEVIAQAIRGQLSRYKQPKRWIALDEMPRNAQGKINRAQLRELLSQAE
jgi:O-succinylbenzoic acid--CoA ligase